MKRAGLTVFRAGMRGVRRLTHGAYTVGSLTVVLDDNDHVLLVKCRQATRHIDFVFSTSGARGRLEAQATGLEVTHVEWVPLPDAPPRLSFDAQRALALATQGAK